jgi:hypothetical protein
MSPSSARGRVWLHLAVIALLAVIAYAPTLSIPLLEDDYGNIGFAIDHGSLSALPSLLGETVFRVRATSYWFLFGLWRTFGLSAVAMHSACLLLHIANCWLIYAIWKDRPRVALFAAAFFAIQEGHQEAVMWVSACNELLMFFFGAASLLLWLRAGDRFAWRLGSAVLFGLALLSKESAAIWLPLFLLAAIAEWRPGLVRLLPHAALAAAAIVLVFATRSYSFRFSDGSFSVHAPFWITWPRSFARLMWPWGWLSLAALAWARDRKMQWAALPALAWMGIALAPYSFLTYSTQIPSRQTYVASAGLAMLVGLALATLRQASPERRRLAAAAAAAILLVNIGYLWTRKRSQFVQRAQPTEQLIRLARATNGPIYIRCFPRNQYIAEEAVRIGAGRPAGTVVWTARDAADRGAAATFCYQDPR